MTHEAFVQALRRERATAILRTERADAVRWAIDCVVDAGFRIVEVTLTTPGALDAIAATAAGGRALLVGAGTVLTPDDVRRAGDAGAAFLVSPVVDEEVIAAALDAGLPMAPGCRTPTEFLKAHRAGAPVQKLFPGVGAGPEYIRSLLAPLPFLNVLPTSGVTPENAAAHLEAGAIAVGYVGTLFDSGALAARDRGALSARAAECLRAVRAG